MAATELSTPPESPQIPAGKPADDPARSHLFADLGDLGLAIGGHRPVADQTADPVDEIGDQLAAIGGVDDLGMELGAVESPRLVRDHRERRAVAGGDDLEAGGEPGDLVAVAHPHLVTFADVPQPVEQRAVLCDGQEGAAEFALPLTVAARFDPAAELVRHDLLAVADTQDGEAAVEEDLRRARAAFFGHAGG
jgi:hypothetical protein